MSPLAAGLRGSSLYVPCSPASSSSSIEIPPLRGSGRARSGRKARLQARAEAGQPVILANGAEPGLGEHEAAALAAAASATAKGWQDDLVNGGLRPEEKGGFVQHFRMASAYIVGHRARTFVVVVPGEVVESDGLLYPLLGDIMLLHGLGVRVVLVLGATPQIDAHLASWNKAVRFEGGYRVTDQQTMQAVIDVVGRIRLKVEAAMSKALAVPVVRRHTRASSGDHHYGPAVSVTSGNFVTGKHRGVVDGVDFGSTGSVRGVQVEAVRQQLDQGHIVLLGNLAFTAAGEALNCNAYDVATHAAVELEADKLVVVTLNAATLQLPQWLSLTDAEATIAHHLESLPASQLQDGRLCTFRLPQAPLPASKDGARSQPLELDLDCWQALGLPNGLLAAVSACKNGVKRSHLIDARTNGGLLLELYTRDGAGTMVSTDFYEGIRAANERDLDGVDQLLKPLAEAGITKHRSRSQLMTEMPHFTVVERESKLLGCALLLDCGTAPDGVKCAELAAFCVAPGYRGSGRGDSLLDYVEQQARDRGVRRLVLLTTRTADWFEQRAFSSAGVAHESELLPVKRRAAIEPSRNSKLFVKTLQDIDHGVTPMAGKRIGF